MHRPSNDFIPMYFLVVSSQSNQTHVHSMKTRSLLVILILWGILVFIYVQLQMVLRMVYWCTPIGIMLQRSISYTLASYGRNCLLYFLSKRMCKLQSKLLAHIQGEQLLPFEVHETCPYPLHMVNMLGQAIWIQMNLNSYLCVRVVINYQKEGD